MATTAASDNAPDTTVGDGNTAAHWGAVYAMALCSFVLIASEFMPVSLLSPIAQTLQLSEGQAGQAISVSGFFAVGTSLFITTILGQLDRRIVLIGLTVLLMISGAIVAFAPSFLVLMIGRALLGVGIGGFWSMSTATAMRLVRKEDVPKAVATISAGIAIASTLAAPLGSLMGGLIGWRATFFSVVPIAGATMIWLALTLPPLPVSGREQRSSMTALLRHGPLMVGLVGVGLIHAGQFGLFTYLRPFLEQVTHVNVTTLSALLLVIGVSGFLGTMAIGRLVGDYLFPVLIGLPAIMALSGGALVLFGGSFTATAVLLAIWGFTSTAQPVGWWTWLARTAPNDAEAAGGLLVAVAQMAITLGAGLGGVIFDASGPKVEFMSSAAVLVLAALAALWTARHHARTVATA